MSGHTDVRALPEGDSRKDFPHCKRCGIELNRDKRATHDGHVFAGWLCYPCWRKGGEDG